MKRKICVLLIFGIMFFEASCVNFYPFNTPGVFESEDPEMIIYFDFGDDTPVDRTEPDVVRGFGRRGKLTKEDGSVVDIIYSSSHSAFKIFEVSEEWTLRRDDPVLYSGVARPRGDNTLVLKVDDGSEIILNKVSELPD